MTIRQAGANDIRAVALNMRERDFAELSATCGAQTRAEMAEHLVARYGGRPDVLVGYADDTPVCIGGTPEVWPNVISLLFLSTPEFARIGLGMTRWIKRELFPRYFAAGIHRIQAVSLDSYEDMHRWLEALGMKREAAFEKFGRDGETFVQFAMVRS